MTIAKNAKAAVLAIALCSGAGAHAAALPFTGHMTALAHGAADPTCAPLLFRNTVSPGDSSGTSSLGNFSYAASSCTDGISLVSGVFALAFTPQDSFQGTFDGTVSPTGTPGVGSPHFTYTILSGTGRFLDATGTFLGTGTIDFREQPAHLNFFFDGLVNAPAVPEPATWSIMLVGVGAAGWSLRRRRAQNRLPAAA